MGLICNIDPRGKTVRIVGGTILVCCGIGLIIVALMAGGTGCLIAGIVAVVGGGFAIFEGVRGWCALRALGVKTRL